MFTKVPRKDAGLPTTVPGTEVSKSCSTTMVTTIIADSKLDDAVPQANLHVDSSNSTVSQQITGYHSAANYCGNVATPNSICDAAPTQALAKLVNAPMATKLVTIGTQCDADKLPVLQSSYVETSASSQCVWWKNDLPLWKTWVRIQVHSCWKSSTHAQFWTSEMQNERIRRETPDLL
jgi:hypothetical protein